MDVTLEQLMTIIRDKTTGRAEFRRASQQISRIIAYNVMKKLPMEQIHIETPLSTATGICFSHSILLVPILRSGMAMLPAFLEVFPDARVGIVGLKRDDRTAIPHWYYHNVPSVDADTYIIVLDPMIATGGTGVATLAYLHRHGAYASNIIFASIVSAPEGIAALRTAMPEVTIICAAYDQLLNSEKFIIPGLGDFGDRYFGTE